ncbi:docking protein 1-like [Megalops cyprinoides]|uniref:docking protein 1-like n=1 Tax=Megalops cyprinoides TaxID=118141 RepID=UPI001864EABA|nr:docking protein 1-like [Megalops cyprinoides]
MDAHAKEGPLYMQQYKLVKKWKKSWSVLYPDSPSGVARLEVFESGSGEKPGGRRADRKVIRLSECITVLPAPEEACPHDGMAAFCVHTADRSHVFAADSRDSVDWVQRMCELAFQGSRGTDSWVQRQPHMEENLIYESREEVRQFWVSVQRTEASDRCGLQGAYWLSVDSDGLVLKEPDSRRTLLAWPYRLLRRYGRDKGAFSMEAGRRCESGPGSFTFETQQGVQIFGLVEAAIREQRALAEEEGPRSCVTLDPGVPEGERQSPRSCSPAEDPSDVYSEPLDCVQEACDATEGVYADPQDSVPAPSPSPRPPSPGHHHGDAAEPLYAEVYDQVRPDPGLQALRSERCGGEPVRKGAVRGSPKAARARRPPDTPLPHRELSPVPDSQGAPEPLYSQVFKHTHQKSTWNPDQDDVIYDNLGVI